MRKQPARHLARHPSRHPARPLARLLTVLAALTALLFHATGVAAPEPRPPTSGTRRATWSSP